MLQQNAVLTFTAKCSMIALSKMLRGGKIMENSVQTEMKFCKHCGQKIDKNVVVCPYCGKQVEILEQAAQPQVVINNSNMNTNTNTNTNVNGYVGRNAKNKWVAFCLCLFLGFLGAHKFYEGKAGRGILYLFTCGLCGVGVIIDLIAILSKPNPYFPK